MEQDLERDLARKRLLDFTKYTFHGYQDNWHHKHLCKKLDQFADGSIKRLMVFMPPRHGKTELVSRRLPAFIFGMNPDAEIIACSYGADLARSMNRQVQRIIDTPEYRILFPKTSLFTRHVRTSSEFSSLRNTDEFEIVDHKGAYKSSGVGGGIVGRGFNFGIIDDPIKDREQADSQVYREKIWEWYTSVFYTRQEAGASILLTVTRWHEDDLAGRLIRQMVDGGEQWQIVDFPAVKMDDENPDDPRETGDALWPRKKNDSDLEQIKITVGARDWASLYQQRPAPMGGDIFKRKWFKYYHMEDGWLIDEEYRVALEDTQRFAVVDLATSKESYADYTVIGVFAGAGNRNLYLLDIHRERMEGPDIIPTIKSMISKWNIPVVFIEQVGFQKSMVQLAIREGIPARKLTADKDKVNRAYTATSQMESGQYFLPTARPWLASYESEILSFGGSGVSHDDQVDVTTYAINHWIERKIIPDMPVYSGRKDSPSSIKREFNRVMKMKNSRSEMGPSIRITDYRPQKPGR